MNRLTKHAVGQGFVCVRLMKVISIKFKKFMGIMNSALAPINMNLVKIDWLPIKYEGYNKDRKIKSFHWQSFKGGGFQ